MKAISRYEKARMTIPALMSGGATRATPGRDEGDTPLRDGKDDDTHVDERRCKGGRHQSGTRARSRERDRKDDGARVGRSQG